jgi:hypothetical protein
MAVSPDIAKQWLENNTRNRNLRRSRVEAYARDMASGRWRFNGDPIRFAVDGTLLDGQHRLQALIDAGATIQFLVIWGLPVEAQDTMDIGAHRTMADALSLRGEERAPFVAAIARRVVMFDAGFRASAGGSMVPTHAEMAAYIEGSRYIQRSAEVANRARSVRLPAAPSVIGAAYEVCARNSQRAADTFYVEKVIEGIGLTPGDPALTYRARLQREAANGRQMPPDDVFRYALLAWNAFRSGQRLMKLQAPRGGWTAKNFPTPR